MEEPRTDETSLVGEELHLGERTRRRNVTLDWGGIDSEKLRRLKQARASAKRELTKAVNRVSDALIVNEDTVEIRAVEEKLDEAFCSFGDAWEKHKALLDDDDDVEESESYFHEAKMKYLCSKDRLAMWFESKKKTCSVTEEQEPSEIGPKDSISQSTSSCSSRSSRSSRSSKATIEEKHFSNATKMASLRAEALMLKQHQNIANEELRISQLKQRLKLETQLAKLEAEERVCLEFKTMTDGPYDGELGKAPREMSTDDITARPLSFLQAKGVVPKICPTRAMSEIEKTTKNIPGSYKSVIEPRTKVITAEELPDDQTVYRHPQVLNTRSHVTSLKKGNDVLQQQLDVSPSVMKRSRDVNIEPWFSVRADVLKDPFSQSVAPPQSPFGTRVDVPSPVMNPHAPPWRPKYDRTLMANDRLSIDGATLQQLDEATGSQPNDAIKDQQRNRKDGRNANNSFNTASD
eukprot:gene11497-12692_t